MKQYTAVEAIKKAKEHPDWVFKDKHGDYFDHEIFSFFSDSDYAANEPYTAHRLIPAESEQISAAAAIRGILKGWGAVRHISNSDISALIENIEDVLTEGAES